jgi:hypothetical protein
MALLKRILYLQALVWAVAGGGLVLFPGLILHDLFSQPDYAEYAWVRVVGIQGFVLALVMVMVAHRIDTLWWWFAAVNWAFALSLAWGLARTGQEKPIV